MRTLPARIQRSFAAAHPSLSPGATRRFGRVAVVALLALLVLVTGQRPAAALAWRIETVDFSGRVGLDTSLALDAAGNPHISYFDYTSSKLKYAAWNGTGWDVQIVDTTADVGEYTSLALNDDGWPRISYYDWTHGALKYAAWNGAEWELQTLDDGTDKTGTGLYTSLELDSDGNPHISYHDRDNHKLKYAVWDGTNWVIETIDAGYPTDFESPLALDSRGAPHIAYYRIGDATLNDVMYATKNGSDWDIESVATDGDVGWFISLALDADGRPHISYYDWEADDLEYATWDGADWAIEEVDTARDVGWYASLAVDAAGNPRISYYDNSHGNLKYAAWNGSSWVVENVDIGEGMGLYTSLALDACGNPHISYYDQDQGDLKYAAGGACATLTVVKSVSGGSGGPWSFGFTSAELGPFTLTNIAPSATFNVAAAGDYAFSETPVVGYVAAIACDNNDTSPTGDITVTLASGDNVTCTVTNTVDNAPPGVTINQAAGQADPTNTTPIYFTVVFSEPVSGFTDSDVTLSGTTEAIITVMEIAPKDGTTYTVGVTAIPSGTYTVSATIPAGVAQDAAGNGNTASTSTDNSVAYDDISMVVFLTKAAGQTDPTNTVPINFTVDFIEGVTGFTSDDVKLSGTAGATTAMVTPVTSDYTSKYNVAVSGMTSDGAVTVNILAGAARDAAGNRTLAAGPTSVTYDTVGPSVAINQASAQADPTGGIPINFTIVFSEAVSGFATGDVTLSGTAGATTATVMGSGMTYNVAVSGMTANGTVIASVGAGVAQDAAGNGNTASGPADDNTVTYDATAPTTTITANPNNPSNSANASFSFTGNDGSGVGGVTFECQMDGGAWTACTSPQAYSGLSDGSHTFAVRAKDSLGNTDSSPAGYTWLIDTTLPSVTINQALTQADPTGGIPIHFTVVFSEAVSDFTTGDVTLSGTAGATTQVVTEVAPMDGTTYNVAVSGMTASSITGSGTVIAAIGAGVAQDAAGNGNTASTSTDNTVIYAPLSIYVSTTAAGSVNGLSFGSEDILAWDGSAWSVWFDGSAAGLQGNKANINAFTIPEAGNAANSDTVLMSFIQNARVIPGVGKVDGMDLVTWNGSVFSLTFDGQDVGLTSLTAEKIDGLHELDPSLAPAAVKAAAGGACLRYFLISTAGNGKVTNYDGSQLNISGEDVLGFCATQLGATTAGKWHMLLDGSAQGVKPNNITSIAASADGQTLFLTSNKAFNVDGAAGGHSMVYTYNMATQTFSGPIFSAPATGLHEKVDGVDVIGAVP